jgi:DNA-binding NtrC family response regulator
METILAVDDEHSVQESYRMILGHQFHLIVASDGLAALDCLENKQVDLLLLDLTMPRLSGVQVLRELEARGDSTPTLVVTASDSVASAVDAMKLGARDYITKPFDVDDLRSRIESILAEKRARSAMLAGKDWSGARCPHFETVVGDAPLWREALAKAERAMQVDSTVLLTGETGTGKDVLAQAIHRGSRKGHPFVPLSCCAIPRELIESELFGVEKGAYTGATESRTGKMQLAHGGTLFLDEIGEMPLEAQAKLLRVLEDGCFYPLGGDRLQKVNVRFVCATNRPFDQSIAEGRFRKDLYYRINVLPIALPPLRERRDDIPALVAHFIAKHGPRVGAQAREFAPRAMARILAYSWPGNVRELENAVERILVCYGQEHLIRAEFLDDIVPRTKPDPASPLDSFEGLPLHQATQRLEQHLIRRALERCNYVQSHTAEMLGTTRRVLKYKMDQLEIDTPEKQDSMTG